MKIELKEKQLKTEIDQLDQEIRQLGFISSTRS